MLGGLFSRHGERLRLELPGGGGFGDPKEREREKVLRDVLVSLEAAEKVCGIKLGRYIL
jgi:N-methylhydantoinase B